MSSDALGIALVTGAAQGIGRAIALRLADDGFDIAINDIHANTLMMKGVADAVQAKGRRAIVVAADVSVDAEVKQMVDQVVSVLGSLEVMIANAAVAIVKPLVGTTVVEFDDVQSVNTRGVFLCYKYAAIQMISQGRGGRIIGCTSSAGKLGEPQVSAYSASKFAVRGLTESAAWELGPHKITVNAYAPGTIDTPMARGRASTPELWNRLLSIENPRSKLGHIGECEDVANLVSFMASKASSFITGQTISVDGGRI